MHLHQQIKILRPFQNVPQRSDRNHNRTFPLELGIQSININKVVGDDLDINFSWVEVAIVSSLYSINAKLR